MLDDILYKEADVNKYTHTHKMPSLAAAFHLVRKLTGFEPSNTCVCVRVLGCMPVMGYVDKVNLSKPQRGRLPNTNRWDSQNDRGWGKEKVFIHPQLVCVFTAVSVFSDIPLCVCVFAIWIQLSGCRAKSLTASLWLPHYRDTAPSRGRREEDTDAARGWPTSVQRLVEEKGWGGGAAAVSFNEPGLLSSAFNLQGCPDPPQT